MIFKDNFKYDDITKINEPSILLTQELQVLTISNPNIKGVLLMGFDVNTLAHSSSALRAGTDMSASVFDIKTAEKLKKYYGKYAQITAGSDFLKIDEIENFQNEKTKEIQKIVIPKMRYVNKILTSDEYEKDTVGAKAYNLRCLETLVKQGKIDVKLPKSIAVPYAFIEEKLNDPENFYDPIGESYEKYEKLLKKLVKNALTIEKEFGAPQDIEGGFLNDGIYLWQTRNIVN